MVNFYRVMIFLFSLLLASCGSSDKKPVIVSHKNIAFSKLVFNAPSPFTVSGACVLSIASKNKAVSAFVIAQ